MEPQTEQNNNNEQVIEPQPKPEESSSPTQELTQSQPIENTVTPAKVPDLKSKNRNKIRIKFRLDLRIISIVLLAIIVAMLAIWKPWASAALDESKTIRVTGEAIVKAVPDEYVFNPSYKVESSSKEVALVEVSKKSTQIVGDLKKLGVAESKIKTSSGGYDYSVSYSSDDKEATYFLRVTVTVDNLTLAQKVQDYLLTTSPIGQVTPSASFSEKKKKEVENQARDEATKDARNKADQMAKNLGFKVGKVKSVTDSGGFGSYYLDSGRSSVDAVAESQAGASSSNSISVQPGENDLDYSVVVTYYIR